MIRIKITNTESIETPIISAIDHILSLYTKGSADYSVTDLISSPRRRQLTIRHDAEIVTDYSDLLFMFLGSVIHYICQHGDQTNAIHEYRFFLTIPMPDGSVKVVSGAVDRTEEHRIIDYKVTSTYSFLLGEKIEWNWQLNIYAFGMRQEGFEIEAASIQAILRDWVKTKARRDSDYPRKPFQKQPIAIERDDTVLAYIVKRCEAHAAAENLPDDELPLCTDAEMWSRPLSFAVVKKGCTKADRVLETEAAAWAWLEKKFGVNRKYLLAVTGNKYRIEERPTERVRCEQYCYAAPFCNQYEEYLKEINDAA